MSYSEKAAAASMAAQQIVQAADRPTKIRAALDMINKLGIGAEITTDNDGTIIYIPRNG